MKEAPFTLDMSDDNQPFDIKEVLFKYLRYWPWFIGSLLLFILAAIAYMRYAPITYESVAKIQIVDDSKELNVAVDPVSLLNGGSQKNLDNEIEVLKSYRILSQVVENLNLDVAYFIQGNIKKTEIWNPPFTIVKTVQEDSLKIARKFNVRMLPNSATITDKDDKVTEILYRDMDSTAQNLPFRITLPLNVKTSDYQDINYEVVLKNKKETVLELAKAIQVQPTSKKSDIISLTLKGESPTRSEVILNTLISQFNQDGILDRQLISRRTLEFIDERFIYLSSELDSIEGGKQDFKQQNSLSYIEADAGISLERKSLAESEVADLETQISLSGLLKKTVIGQAAYNLLPMAVGLENVALNNLVQSYNDLVLERDKLILTVGEQHPSLIALSSKLETAKVNIIKTINVYQTQLRASLGQLNREQSIANSVFSRLPEKEKMLRSIERQQRIKENLFMLLLQKREEAAINLAITAPSIKVVDYGLTKSKPLSPKGTIVFGISFIMALLLPFSIIYAKSVLETKISTKSDVEKLVPDIPIVGEIPHFKNNKNFTDINDRSVLAESFRILATNINYVLLNSDSKEKGKVVYVTSSVDGEGKSIIAHNLSVAYSSLNKKVLLVGADLRRPKLHNFFGMGQQSKGLSDLLNDNVDNWKDYVYPGQAKNNMHRIILSGPIPENAPMLLSGNSFGNFIKTAKKEFDYIVVDTSPIGLVTDTMLISQYADVTLLVARSEYTDKETLERFRSNEQTVKLRNVAMVLNDVKSLASKKYGYGD